MRTRGGRTGTEPQKNSYEDLGVAAKKKNNRAARFKNPQGRTRNGGEGGKKSRLFGNSYNNRRRRSVPCDILNEG